MLHAKKNGFAGLPFLRPARLAVGLELEVFYSQRSVECQLIRPGFRIRETGGFPALQLVNGCNFG